MIGAGVTALGRRVAKATADALLPSSMLVVRGPRVRRVALTFDDGPTEWTLPYLDVLEQYGVRATFFLVGQLCADRPADVVNVAAHGHEIGGHGYTHRPFSELDRSELEAELERTAALLPPAGRRLVRPPHGALNVRSLHAIASAGFTTVLWSYDSDDCRTEDASALSRRFREKPVTMGDIVLLHEGQPWTLHVLPALIEALAEAGHELCTVSELVGA